MLLQHKRTVVEGIKVKYYCNSCDFKATYPRQLKQHTEAGHDVSDIFCKSRNLLWNMKHRKGIIHVWIRHSCDSCDYIATELSNLKRHTESKHERLYMTFLYVQLFCVLQVCSFDISWCSHYMKWYFIPSWIVLLCRARSPFDVAYCWLCSQGIFIPSWTVHLCCARSPSWTSLLSNQDFLLLLLDTDIVHMDISFLHELSLCRGKSPFDELLFCVLQDFFLMLL